jgi:hypothetical protein
LQVEAYAGRPGTAGFLEFRQGEIVYVWNKTGDRDADLTVVGPDGALWMEGWKGWWCLLSVPQLSNFHRFTCGVQLHRLL